MRRFALGVWAYVCLAGGAGVALAHSTFCGVQTAQIAEAPASALPRLPRVAAAQGVRPKIPLPAGEASLLFYKGPELTMEALLADPKLAEELKEELRNGNVRLVYNPATGIGAVVSLTGESHGMLTYYIPDEKMIRGGTRYYGSGRRNTSLTYAELPGEKTEDENFEVEFGAAR